MQKVIIGIDPGKITGYAVWDPRDRVLVYSASGPIHKIMGLVMFWGAGGPEKIMVVVEDARKRSWFGNSGPERWKGAGSIMRDCTIWEDFLTDNGIPFKMVAPRKGGTKWPLSVFKKVTGVTGRTNEHERDAIALVFGYIN